MTRFHTRKDLACKCGCGLDVTDELLDALEALLESINKPIRILSGARCPKRNKEVGGTPDSMHLRGIAADITCYGLTTAELIQAAIGIPAFFSGGIGIYPGRGFVHVDVRGVRARWGKIGNRTCSYGEAWDMVKKEE